MKHIPNKRRRVTLTIDITKEQRQMLRQLLPHGTQNKIYRALTEELIEVLKPPDLRQIMIAMLIAREYKLIDNIDKIDLTCFKCKKTLISDLRFIGIWRSKTNTVEFYHEDPEVCDPTCDTIT